MIKLEKLEKGEFFEDAFLVSYRLKLSDKERVGGTDEKSNN